MERLGSNLLGMRLGLALAALALWFSAYAPLLDHHFAERLPGHAHVYPKGSLIDHEHSYEQPHSHPPSAGTSALAESRSPIAVPSGHAGGGVISAFMVDTAVLPSIVGPLLLPLLLLAASSGRDLARASMVSFVDTPPPQFT